METKETIIEGNFTSFWKDGTMIETKATLNLETGFVDAENSEDDSDHGYLENEYFTDEDGVDYEICPDCHCYILKTVNGKEVCSNIECSNN